METTHSVEGYFGSEFLAISNQLWQPEVVRR